MRDRYKQVVLDAMPGTRKQIREKTGLPIMTVFHWTTATHAAGDAHISGWHRPPKGQFAPIFSAGAGQDKPCELQYLGNVKVSQQYRARLRKSGEWVERQARFNARRRADTAAKTVNPWFGALLGAGRAAA